jgi:ComF family protein
MKKLLAAYKYPPYVKDLENILVELFYESLIQQELFMKLLQKDIVFVSIPLALRKYRTRGYNQAEELAKLLGNKLQVVVIHALQRVKETKTQVNLTKEEREKNIKGAFIIDGKFKSTLEDTVVVLVDDVLTTGATMSEATEVLYTVGVKEVWGITLSHGK